MSGEAGSVPDRHTNQLNPADVWDGRYAADSYLYGTEPNTFLRSAVADVPIGAALCLADGEGRNGVFLAELGYRVTSVDMSERGMAKAQKLASERGVELETLVSDLATFDLGVGRWDLIVSIFAHTPPATRAALHGSVATALRPGGYFILEAYTPDQLGRGTGGPPSAKFMMTLDLLREELTAMTIQHGAELLRPINEGPAHSGEGAVVQLVARP